MKVIQRGGSVTIRGRLDPGVEILVEYGEDVMIECRHPERFTVHRRDGKDPRCLVCGMEGVPGPPFRTFVTYDPDG